MREIWKSVVFEHEYCNDFSLQVSNLGRVKSFNKVHPNGNIIKGSTTNGYKIIRLTFFKHRTAKQQKFLNELDKTIKDLYKEIGHQKKLQASQRTLKQLEKDLLIAKEEAKKEYAADMAKRRFYWHGLVHRLVATYFIEQPSNAHCLVAHKNHNKTDNHYTNLQWMTPEQNMQHQQKSPLVKAARIRKIEENTNQFNSNKLTVTKVMLLKKLINQGKSNKQLVKTFKISDTQIKRIKRGENWGNIPAAN